MFFPTFLKSQLLVSIPPPQYDLSGQRFIVTGSNVGLGLEAARHLVRLNAQGVILAVRDIAKGEAAKKAIEESTSRQNVVEVWQLDLGSYDSVKTFAKRAEGLDRLDAVIENAGMATWDFKMLEDDESTITVNVVSTFLLALLLLPKLRESALRFNILPRLVIVSSEAHFFASFPEGKSERIFEALNNKDAAKMDDRYSVSKLLEIFIVRELAEHLNSSSEPAVVLNCMNPGLCHSDLTRDATGPVKMAISLMKASLARTTEVGGRTLVHAAMVGKEGHGQYLSDCKVAKWVILCLCDTVVVVWIATLLTC